MFKKLLYIIFLNIISITTYGSVSDIISDGPPDPYYKIIDSANIYINKNPLKAIIYLEKALNLSLNNSNNYQENQCYILLGKANLNLKLYDQSIRYYLKASSETSLQSKKSRVSVGINPVILEGLCLAYEGKNEISNTRKYLAQLETNIRYASNSNNKAWINNFKGRLAFQEGDQVNAIKYFELVSKNEKIITKHELVVEANDYLSKIYDQDNKKTKSKEYLSKSYDAAGKSENKELIVQQGRKLKKAYNDDKEYEKSLELSNDNVVVEEIAVQNQLDDANVYVKQNKPEKAIPLLEKTIIQNQKLGQIEEKKEAYKILSKAYEQQGNSAKALENYRLYVKLNDSIFAKKEIDLKNTLTSQANISEVNQRINLLEKNKQLSEQKIETLETDKAFQNTLIYGLMFIMFIVLLSAYLLYKNIRQKKIANQLLALKSLRSQMNPHFIFNALNSVNSFISSNDQKTANKYLADFSKLMRLVLENSQKDFVALSEEIEVLQLYLKLEHFRFSNKFDYEFEIDEDTFVEQYKIPPMLIQPYIENAVWHGLRYIEEKGLLKVKIWATEKSINVEIIDNGIGRKRSQELKTHNQKQNESMGLKNIETRLAIINDIYKTDLKVLIQDVDPAISSGTKVSVSIPFIKEN